MKDYVQAVLENVRGKRLRREAAAELSCHVEEKAALYASRGFSPEAALEKANADLGEDAETVAAQLSGVHRAFGARDVLFLLFELLFLAAAGAVRFIQFTAERDALYMFADWETQPPFFLGLPGLVLPLFTAFTLFHTAVLLVSLRRRYVLSPVLCAVSLAVCGRFHFALPAALGAIFCGQRKDFFYRWANFRLFAGDARPIAVSFALYSLLAGFALFVGIVNATLRRGGQTKKTLRLTGRMRRAVLAVACAGLAVYAALAAGLLFAERAPQLGMWGTACVLAEDENKTLSEPALRETFRFALEEHVIDCWARTETEPAQSRAFEETTEKRLEPCCGWLCSPVTEVVCLAGRTHPYYLVALFTDESADNVYGRVRLSEQTVVPLSPGETLSLRWSSELWDYRLTVVNP